jgi:uncharacterized Zn-binding protein involved in type VI secretion
MGSQAIVMGDKITGMCAIHQIPNPASGVPQPSPAPLPFSAPLTQGLAPTVLIGSRAAAVINSKGLNTPPHVGLHGSDPYMTPTMQVGRILTASTTVYFEGQPAATATSQVTCCLEPGSLVPTVTTVLIG